MPLRAPVRVRRDPLCGRCTFINGAGDTHCAMCAAKLSASSSPSSSPSSLSRSLSPSLPPSLSPSASHEEDDDSDVFEEEEDLRPAPPPPPRRAAKKKQKQKEEEEEEEEEEEPAGEKKAKAKAKRKKKKRQSEEPRQGLLTFAVAASPSIPAVAAAAPAPAPAAATATAAERPKPPSRKRRSPGPEPGAEQVARPDWVTVYEPASTAELIVNAKKVGEVRTWLTAATAAAATGKSFPKAMVLFGPPGVGKSAMARTLAAECGLGVRTWVDTYGAVPFVRGAEGEMALPYESQLQQFQDFLRRSASYVALDDPRGHLILLEDLPHTHSAQSRDALGQALIGFLRVVRFPVILVFSDGAASNGRSYELDRIVGADLMCSPYVCSISVNPAATTSIKKRLQYIAGAEGASVPSGLIEHIAEESRGDLRHAINALQFALIGRSASSPSSSAASASASAPKTKKARGAGKGKAGAGSGSGPGEATKDRFRSNVHAIGKLMTMTQEKAKKDRPGDVVAGCGMDADMVAQFVSHNCPRYFTDIFELTDALATLSDADTFSHPRFFSQRDDVFPLLYSQALVGRAVVTAKRSPPVSQSSAVKRPQMLDVRKKRKWLGEEFRRLRVATAGASSAALSENDLATDVLPLFAAMRRAGPDSVALDPMFQPLAAARTLSAVPSAGPPVDPAAGAEGEEGGEGVEDEIESD